jgi:lipopolysaccharide/colanic/teichoic acid biosynthesis glycosyltransferase
MAKRFVDILVATVGLVLLAPLLILIGLIIKLDSSGPVFFRQERVGRNGRSFRIFKFRTMVQGAYKMGSRLTTKRDPRVTRVGQILRWFKIDEVPQLINVLVGDMSLIGPRPEDPHFVAYYDEHQRQVLNVRPGMLGPSQILGRDELESYPEGLRDTEQYYVDHILPEKLERDLEYVQTASFLGDMSLLLRGVWATVVGAFKAKFLWRRRYRIALFLLDAGLIVTSCYLAFMIRADFTWPARSHFFIYPLVITLAARLISLAYFGAYQGVLAYFGLWDMLALVKAIAASALVAGGLTFFIGMQSFPRSVFVIDSVLVLLMLAGLRYVLRGVSRGRSRSSKGKQREKALVVGAGMGGEQIVRALLDDPACPYRPVGFIDESPERWGSMIHGIRILGGAAEVPLAVSANGIEAVFICISDLSERGVAEVVEICQKVGVEYRVVPTLSDLLNGDHRSGESPAAVNGGVAATG